MECRRSVRAIGTALLVGLVLPWSAPFAGRVEAAASITLDGHGYGHGVGLSQYGALGYAVNSGWSSAQILDHYYGGTVASTAPNSDMTVRLAARDGAHRRLRGRGGAAGHLAFARRPRDLRGPLPRVGTRRRQRLPADHHRP